MLKQKTEYSRYYGDFRGVDFSTDHTLVSERRFPYLVNMYKDYASGAGQGIETIPGFRRRFVAPNGGKVHGIHSFKDKGGKRHVYVHAGDRLYDWKKFPSSAGVETSMEALVVEYDERSAGAEESVRIDTDYLKIDVATTATEARFIDIRAIRKVGSLKWISIYTEAVYDGEVADAIRISNAYTIVQKTDEAKNVKGAVLRIPKVIKDSSGTAIATFEEGDAIEAQSVVTYSYPTDEQKISYSYRDITVRTTPRGDKIYFEKFDSKNISGNTLMKYSVYGGQVSTAISKGALPQEVEEGCDMNDVARIADIVTSDKGIVFEPITKRSDGFYVYLIYDKYRETFYQLTEGGDEVAPGTHATKSLYVYCTNDSGISTHTYTAVEYDEYLDVGKGDYLEITGLSTTYDIEKIRSKNGTVIAKGDGEGQYKRIGNTLLIKKGGSVNKGEFVTLEVRLNPPVEIYRGMNEHESRSFVFNNRLYILDGKNYLYIDVTPEEKIEVETEEGTEIKVNPEKTVVKRVADEAYIPTTYINIVVGGENADAGTEYETRNMLSPYFKHTFVPVDSVTEYCMNERDLDGIKEVKVYGKVMKEGEDADYTVDLTDGKVIFNTPPALIKAGFEAVPGTSGLEYTLTDAGTYVCSGRGSATEDEIIIGNYYNGVRVTEIGNAFNNKGLTYVEISEGIISVGDYSFGNNSSLKTVEFPNSLEHIGCFAFRASGVTELTIPKRVKTIDAFAFEESKNLHTVEFKGKPQDVSSSAFQGCENLENVTVAWSKGAFPWLEDNLESLGATITYKGESAGEEEDEIYYPEAYAGVEITAVKAPGKAEDVVVKNNDGTTTTMKKCPYMYDNAIQMIESATLCTVFDDRVFFSGIPRCPRLILWCGRNLTGYVDPSYIGILNYVEDGVGNSPVKAMLPLANTLLVLKGDTEFDGAVYYHTPHETGVDVMPKTYPSEHGLSGIGCLGAACNFLDDPVFISRLGLEAIGQLSVRYERAREHRSSLIDAKLVNLEGLRDAKTCEWGGYLVLLVDGKIFLADSRQVYQNDRGEVEYEWYYLEDIGVFEGQYKRERYIAEWPELFTQKKAVSGEDGAIPQSSETTAPFTQGSLTGDTTASTERMTLTVTYEGKEYTVQLASDVFPDYPPKEVAAGLPVVVGEVEVNGKVYNYDAAIYSVSGTPTYAFLCDGNGEMIGGEFSPAVTVKSIEEECKAESAKGRVVENLFFGTENGVVCSFNFDEREADGTIPAKWYTFDGRAIYSGCALKMDNCGIPHMTKTTVKRSTVIKVKSFMSTAAKVRVRTNRNPYNEIARINGTRFSFENMDFSDFSFVTGEDSLFSVQEKE